jgi:RimJ/RimL family protein N-acetyltransferase
MIIETERLILRQWKDEDKQPLYELNSNPEVMKYFPNLWTKERSDLFVDYNIKTISEDGWGWFAVDEKKSGRIIGFIGLAKSSFQSHFSPFTEIGWRLDNEFWKNGYATEGAKAVLSFAFNELKKSEIVSFTSTINLPSIAVMERIGMTKVQDGGFDHPKIEADHKLCRHVLYRIINKHT